MPDEKIAPVLMLATIGITAIASIALQSQCDNFEDGCTAYSNPPEVQASSPRPEAFRLAVNKAMSAAKLVQTAKTPEAWQLVTIQWQEAIDLMRAVPKSSPNYKVAQEKVAEYQTYLQYAQGNIGTQTAVVSASAPVQGTVPARSRNSALKNLGITKVAFEQIEVGMSYADVKTIIGKSGKELNRFEMPGVLTVVMYQWQTVEGSNIYGMFEDDKLTNKNQFGLK